MEGVDGKATWALRGLERVSRPANPVEGGRRWLGRSELQGGHERPQPVGAGAADSARGWVPPYKVWCVLAARDRWRASFLSQAEPGCRCNGGGGAFTAIPVPHSQGVSFPSPQRWALLGQRFFSQV